MKQYQYKIQWLFSNIKNFKKVIEILGIRSLDKIILRDIDLNIIDEYRGFIQYPYGLAEKETLKYVRKQFKNNNEIYCIEVLRK